MDIYCQFIPIYGNSVTSLSAYYSCEDIYKFLNLLKPNSKYNIYIMISDFVLKIMDIWQL